MMILLLAFFFAQPALCAPCPGPTGTPCTPTQGDKTNIINIISLALDAEMKMLVARENKVAALNSKKDEAAGAFQQEEEDRESEMRRYFAEVLRLTSEAYNIAPGARVGLVVAPKDPEGRGGWSSSRMARWKPEVLYEDRFIGAIRGADGRDHYYGMAYINPQATAGFTSPVGEVRIHMQQLRDALAIRNPGLIAATLYHESRHFNALITSGWMSREQNELAAYTDHARLAASVFELDPYIANQIEASKQHYLQAVKNGASSSPYPNAQDEADLAAAYEQAQRDATEHRRRREELRERAARARAERLAAEKRRVMDEYKSAAAGCGLKPIMTGENLTLGFSAPLLANFYFTEPVSPEQAGVALLLARACVAAERGSSDDEPCVDALTTMRARWQDAAFRHGLELEADSGPHEDCLRMLLEMPQPPASMKSLNKALNRHWAEAKDAQKRRAAEVYREIRRREERAERGERHQNDSPGYKPDYDFTPAYQALEDARGSRFQ